jgi:hypothetical protein
MPFTSYADVTDLRVYVSDALDALFDGNEETAAGVLKRAARDMNERLGGLDRITTIPVAVEDDGEYAEILKRLNVYMAVWIGVGDKYAGEQFSDQWAWVNTNVLDAWKGIEAGKYSFGDEEAATSADSHSVFLGRTSY